MKALIIVFGIANAVVMGNPLVGSVIAGILLYPLLWLIQKCIEFFTGPLSLSASGEAKEL